MCFEQVWFLVVGVHFLWVFHGVVKGTRFHFSEKEAVSERYLSTAINQNAILSVGKGLNDCASFIPVQRIMSMLVLDIHMFPYLQWV